MFDCPTCDDRFETKRGLGVHHSSVHDEQLPNHTCDYCAVAFHSEHQKKYCSESCLTEATSFEGAANPNYRGGKTETTCNICTTPFEYYSSEKEGLYCSTCVEHEQWRELPNIDGSNNPRWNGGTVTVDCDICGDAVERYPSNVGDVVCCTTKCRGRWLSDAFTGEGHPNWTGGGNEAYGKGWNSVREAALERDDYTCVVCGVTREDLERNPDVHHIVPVRAFLESPRHEEIDAHVLENVVSVCIPCHRKAEFGRIPRAVLRASIGVPRPTEDSVPSTVCLGSLTD